MTTDSAPTGKPSDYNGTCPCCGGAAEAISMAASKMNRCEPGDWRAIDRRVSPALSAEDIWRADSKATYGDDCTVSENPRFYQRMADVLNKRLAELTTHLRTQAHQEETKPWPIR